MNAASRNAQGNVAQEWNATRKRRRVGFVGTGTMGQAMVLRLLEEGFEVRIHNRTRSKASELESAGAIWMDSPAAVAEECSVVHGCLRDTVAIESVYLGPEGLLSAKASSRVFLEHATFAPELALTIAETAKATGNGFADVPVSGGPIRARKGTLTSMAGGEIATLVTARESLNTLCSTVRHIGPTGRGLQLKLVNQLLVGIHVAASADAMLLLEALGLPYDESFAVLKSGWADSAMLRRTVGQLQVGETTGTGATISGMAEVLDLVDGLVTTMGMKSEVLSAARRQFAAHTAAGQGADDLAALGRHMHPNEIETGMWI